jgi:hypothetical protein
MSPDRRLSIYCWWCCIFFWVCMFTRSSLALTTIFSLSICLRRCLSNEESDDERMKRDDEERAREKGEEKSRVKRKSAVCLPWIQEDVEKEKEDILGSRNSMRGMWIVFLLLDHYLLRISTCQTCHRFTCQYLSNHLF